LVLNKTIVLDFTAPRKKKGKKGKERGEKGGKGQAKGNGLLNRHWPGSFRVIGGRKRKRKKKKKGGKAVEFVSVLLIRFPNSCWREGGKERKGGERKEI